MALSMEQQYSAQDRVRAALRAAGVSTEVQEFAVSTRTAEEAASAVGTTVGQIVKSLVFVAGEQPVLALVSGSNQLDVTKLAALTGAPVRKADANFVRDVTSFSIGGVPPIGFPSPIPTWVDRDLLEYGDIWAAAGTPRHVFKITPAELVRLTSGIVADLSAGR